MRNLSQYNFLKIVEGRDYEFLINGYPFTLKEAVHLENGQFHSPHKYYFKGCRYSTLKISDTKISSHWSFQNCHIDELVVSSSSVASFEFKNCVIGNLIYKSNNDAGILEINASKINQLEYLSNTKFKTLHIGCDNFLDKVNILDNGAANTEESNFYLCPEEFNAIRIERLTSSVLEIGTFGEYSNLFLNEVIVDHLRLKNCHSKNSEVLFKKVRPRHKSEGVLQFLDSTIDVSVFENDFIKSYPNVEYANSSINSKV
ncbi:hypothetical protein ACV07N_06700 [Roseivirga echinicomitans]